MKRAALLLLTVFALIATGCGSNEENDYVNQVNAADAQAQAAVATVDKPTKSAAASARAFDKAADRLDKVVVSYKAIKPPDNAKKAHALTILGLSGLADLFRDFADDTRAVKTQADVDALKKKAASLTTAKPFRQLAQARQELADAGYKVETPTAK